MSISVKLWQSFILMKENWVPKKATDNVQITDPSKKAATAVFHLSHIKMSAMGSLNHTFKWVQGVTYMLLYLRLCELYSRFVITLNQLCWWRSQLVECWFTVQEISGSNPIVDIAFYSDKICSTVHKVSLFFSMILYLMHVYCHVLFKRMDHKNFLNG